MHCPDSRNTAPSLQHSVAEMLRGLQERLSIEYLATLLVTEHVKL